MAFGVDYSFDRPDPGAMRRNQPPVEFVCRYLRGNGKALSRAESERLNNAGISIVSNDELEKGFMLGGHGAGVAAAKAASAAHKACGGPDHRPIYFSLDVDWKTLSPRQHDAVMAFLDGAASVIGRDRVGIYGGFPTIEAAVKSGKAAWFWQTRAWSDGKLHDRAHIFQFEVDTKKHPVRAFGAAVDFDRSLKADYGQWKIGQHFEEDIDMATGDEIMTFLKTLRQDLTVFGTHGLHETVENFAKNQRSTRNQLDDLEKKVADLATRVQALAGHPHP
jgi:hypothetical protein